MSSWWLIARKDFEDSVRSRMIWGVMGLFVVLMAIIGLASGTGDALEGGVLDIIVLFTNIGGQILVPLIALMVGYMAIVGDRESGRLRVLFGLSHSRKDVFIGKLLSRLTVIFVATLVACLVAIIMALGMFDSVPVSEFAGFIGITLLLGMTFTGIGVGISAMFDSRIKAIGGVFGTYVLLSLFWYPLVAGVHYVIEGELAGYEAPNWYFFLLRLSPLEAYIQTTSSLADQFIWQAIGWQNTVENIAHENTADDMLLLSNRISSDVPFYLSDWFAPFTMVFWIGITAAIGYWRFSRADLG